MQAIAVSASDAATVVVGIEAGAVVRSADTGTTWQSHRSGAMRDCHSLAAHARVGWFYEGGSGGGAISASWWRPGGLDRRYGWAVTVDAANPELWYHPPRLASALTPTKPTRGSTAVARIQGGSV